VHRSGWSTDRKILEREVTAPEYQFLLSELWPRFCRAGCVRTWFDVESVIHRGPRDAPWKDRLLLSILDRRGSQMQREWRSVLLLLFWHDLARISRWHRALDEHEAALRSNVLWSFSEAICRIDTAQRLKRIIQKVRNDTIHDLKQIYSSQPLRSGRFESLDRHDQDNDLTPGDPVAPADPDWVEMEAGLEADSCVRLLKSLVQRGVIVERDLPLLIGTVIYDRPIVDWAADHGISKETAKKRRQRALRRIRPEIRKLKKC
jgi:hypothetical protein